MRVRRRSYNIDSMPEAAPKSAGAAAAALFAAAILLSAFLLFAVQPLIARFILPWFGGAAGVWTTALLFFQALLLAGYAYAHLLAGHLSRRAQAILHVSLLLACVATLPIAPSTRLAPADASHPTLRVLLLLAASVGLPYFALAATSPLVQQWFAGVYPRRSVYRLYALSNLGSLAALVSYPFVVEPALTRRAQAVGWSWLFVAFAATCALCAIVAACHPPSEQDGSEQAGCERDGEMNGAVDARLTRRSSLLVLGLTALASAMLLAVTNKICQDIAPVPFLWLLPLTLYLIAFIVCFEYANRYRRSIVAPLAAAGTLASAYVLVHDTQFSLPAQVATHAAALLLCCLFCLGESARRRPAAREVTGYYLLVALGGVSGAVLVAVMAPLALRQFIEMHLCLMAVWIAGLGILLLDRASSMRRFRQPAAWVIAFVPACALTWLLYDDVRRSTARHVLARRSFYGVIEVLEKRPPEVDSARRLLVHNGTLHGIQLEGPNLRRKPTTYYIGRSGVGLAMLNFHTDRPRRVGVVGLGAGTLCVYGREGDEFTFYELDPDVIDVARREFTFLSDCLAKVRTIAGDARLSLARQEDQHFDILVLDAFSGDSVPVHLLTVEAFALYRRHLAPGGVIAVHLTNRHLNLLPPAWAVAQQVHMQAAFFGTSGDYASRWLLISSDAAFLERLHQAPTYRTGMIQQMDPWTDDHAPVFPILRTFGRR